MVLNPAGYVALFDTGVMQVITGKAREVISGGEFVFASGATGVVSSGTNSYATTDIEFATDASGALVNGVAIANATSGNLVSVMTKGIIIATCNSDVDAGVPFNVDGNNSVQPAGAAEALVVAGRTLTAGASGGYCIVKVDL